MSANQDPRQELRETLNELCAHICSVGEETEKSGIFNATAYESYIDWLEKFINRYADQRVAEALERLHRSQGNGLPKRDYDNEMDELIDEELAALHQEQSNPQQRRGERCLE